MSSLRTVQSSKVNGALANDPSTPAGKLRSAENAIIRGLCADCIVLEDEERENFLNLLQQHVNHFRPVDEVEFGLVEEMCAARWRQRRAWSIETRMFDTQTAVPPDGDSLDHMVAAFGSMAATPSLSLLHRYETRLNLTYQRSLRTLIMLRKMKSPNEPNPISEHQGSQQPTDSESVSSAPPGFVGQTIQAAAGFQPALFTFAPVGFYPHEALPPGIVCHAFERAYSTAP
jgi:hypothetical protein